MFTRYALLLSLLKMPHVVWSQVVSAPDSASSWPPPRQYVILSDSLFSLHHVQAQGSLLPQRPGRTTVISTPVAMETYNLLIPATAGKSWRKGDTLLIAFSLLPNKQGAITWSPLALDTLPAGMLRSLPEVVRDGFARVQAYDQAGKPRDHLLITQDRLLPVVRRAGRYWVPGPYVMTQYFRVRSQATSSLVQTDYVTINIKSPAVSSDAPYRTLRALFPPDVPYEWALFSPIGIVREGAYHGRYEFWSRPPWATGHEPFPRYYGADIFEYKPGIGLLSGRYRSYFKQLDWSKPNAYFDQITVDGHTQLR